MKKDALALLLAEEETHNSITFTWTPDADSLVKEIAERALDEFEYKGKTIREWVELIAGLPEPLEE